MNRRSLPLVGLLVILLSGCFKIDLKIVVEDDGSGSIEGLAAVDAGAFADLGALFGEEAGGDAPSREELCQEFIDDSDVPEGATTEPYEDGDFCGVRFSREYTAEEMQQELANSFEEDGGEFVIERDGEGWRFQADLGDQAAEGADFFPTELFDDAEFTIRVRLPGRQVEHNADRIESDGTMVWNVDLFNPGGALMARTEPGTPITGGGGDDGGSNTVLIIVLVAAAIALAAGAIWWWTKRSKAPAAGAAVSEQVGPADSTMPGDGPPTSPPPAGGPPPAPPTMPSDPPPPPPPA